MRKTVMAAGLAAVLMSGAAHADSSVRDERYTLTETQMESIGCVVSGSAGAIAATAMGPTEIIALIGGAGTIMVPSSPLVAATVIGALVFASFCSAGSAAVPAVVLAYDVAEHNWKSSGWEQWTGDRWAELRNTDVSGAVQTAAVAAGSLFTGLWGAANTMVAGAFGTVEPEIPAVDVGGVTVAQVDDALIYGVHPTVH